MCDGKMIADVGKTSECDVICEDWKGPPYCEGYAQRTKDGLCTLFETCDSLIGWNGDSYNNIADTVSSQSQETTQPAETTRTTGMEETTEKQEISPVTETSLTTGEYVKPTSTAKLCEMDFFS